MVFEPGKKRQENPFRENIGTYRGCGMGSLSLNEERAGKHRADGFEVFIPAEILPLGPGLPLPSDWASRPVAFPSGCFKEGVRVQSI